MTHPHSFRRPATTPPTPSPDAVALDRALDAWVRGDVAALDALDPAMEETVAQLYAWADIAGIVDDPEAGVASASSTPPRGQIVTVSPTPPRPPVRNQHPDPGARRAAPPVSRRTRIMTAFSGLAAALLIGLGIYGAVPIFTDRQHDPTPSQIAFQAATPPESGASAATAVPHDVPSGLIFQGGDPLPAGGDQTVLPPVGTELTGAWGVDALNPVRPEECALAPMPREEAVTILATPPSSDQIPTNQDSTVDEATVSEIQASFRQWQACRRSGNTFGAMALETDAFIRADLYDDGGAMASFQRANQAYSTEAANGVLDVRLSIDTQRAAISDRQAADRAGTEGGLDLNLWIIDMQSIGADHLQAQMQFPAAHDGTYVWAIATWTNPNVQSDQPFPRVSVAFELVDGVWKIDQWNLIGGQPPAGS